MFEEPKIVYIFQCSANWKMYGATLEKKGATLPTNICSGGKWRLVKSHRVCDTDAQRNGGKDDEMRAALAGQGWYIGDALIAGQVIGEVASSQ